MGEVLFLNNAKHGKPNLSGEAWCVHCNHEWVAVAPVGTDDLECPRCLTMKGVFKHPVAPVGPELWECACGNKLFFILKQGFQCVKCGEITKKEDIT